MAAPATYIRTIHTSFTAAQSHSSSAWASAATVSLNHHHHHHHHNPNASLNLNLNLNLTHQPRPHHHQGPFAPIQSINTHNTHMYTHHLRDLAPPRQQPAAQGPTPPLGMVMTQQGQYVPMPPRKSSSPAPGSTLTPTRVPPSPPPQSRRRSASIRMPPSYKFDPFADEPLSTPAAQPVSTVSAVESEPETEVDIALAAPTQPYTIQIPAAAQTDIQRYTAPAPARSQSPSPIPQRALSPRAQSFTPSRPSTPLPSTVSSPVVAQAFPGPNLSKIVAGLILNRVHSGKPMRRRVPPGAAARGQGKQYVKSCLSSVVSVEA